MIYVCIYIIPQCILSFIGKIVKSPKNPHLSTFFSASAASPLKFYAKHAPAGGTGQDLKHPPPHGDGCGSCPSFVDHFQNGKPQWLTRRE